MKQTDWVNHSPHSPPKTPPSPIHSFFIQTEVAAASEEGSRTLCKGWRLYGTTVHIFSQTQLIILLFSTATVGVVEIWCDWGAFLCAFYTRSFHSFHCSFKQHTMNECIEMNGWTFPSPASPIHSCSRLWTSLNRLLGFCCRRSTSWSKPQCVVRLFIIHSSLVLFLIHFCVFDLDNSSSPRLAIACPMTNPNFVLLSLLTEEAKRSTYMFDVCSHKFIVLPLLSLHYSTPISHLVIVLVKFCVCVFSSAGNCMQTNAFFTANNFIFVNHQCLCHCE